MPSLSELSYTYDPELPPQPVTLPDGTVYAPEQAAPTPTASQTSMYGSGSTYIPPGAAESPQTASTPPPPAYNITGGGSNTSDYTGNPTPAPEPMVTQLPSTGSPPTLSQYMPVGSGEVADARGPYGQRQTPMAPDGYIAPTEYGNGSPYKTPTPNEVRPVSPSNATAPATRSAIPFADLNRDHGTINRAPGPIGPSSAASPRQAAPMADSTQNMLFGDPFSGQTPVTSPGGLGRNPAASGGGWAGLMNRIKQQEGGKKTPSSQISLNSDGETMIDGQVFEGVMPTNHLRDRGMTMPPLYVGAPAPGRGYHYDEENLGRIVPDGTPFLNENEFKNRHGFTEEQLKQFTIGTEDEGIVNTNNSMALGGGQSASAIAGGSGTSGGLGVGGMKDPGIISFPDMRTWAEGKKTSPTTTTPKTEAKTGGQPTNYDPSNRTTPSNDRMSTGMMGKSMNTPWSKTASKLAKEDGGVSIASDGTVKQKGDIPRAAAFIAGHAKEDGSFTDRTIADSMAGDNPSMEKNADGSYSFILQDGSRVPYNDESLAAFWTGQLPLAGGKTKATEPAAGASGDLLANPVATDTGTSTNTNSGTSGNSGSGWVDYGNSGGGSRRSSGGSWRSSGGGGGYSGGGRSGGGGGFDWDNFMGGRFKDMAGGGEPVDMDGDGKISAKEARMAKKKRGRKGSMGSGGKMSGMPGFPPDMRSYILSTLGESSGMQVGGWPEAQAAAPDKKKKKS